MSLFDIHPAIRRIRPVKVASLMLAVALVVAPVAAFAAEGETVDEPVAVEAQAPALQASDDAEQPADGSDQTPDGSDQTEDGSDQTPDGSSGELVPPAVGNDVVTLKLAQGTRDYGRAQSVVDAINRLRASITYTPTDATAAEGSEGTESEEAPTPVPLPALTLDGTLQKNAFQRAAETSIWLSGMRPGGGIVTDATELRCHGRSSEPADVMAALEGSRGQLARPDLTSIGVGCWTQGSERFYVILVGTGAADPTDAVTGGNEAWSPEVQVDLSGRTSRLLQGRIQASGYRTNLSMVPGTTRKVSFSWVTAPEEAGLSTAANLPAIAIDPTSFDWVSSNPTAASVSPEGVVTMRGTSVLTPRSSIEAGADITAGLEGTTRSLTFHVSAAVPVYRLYNAANGAHLYTTDANEYNSLPYAGWTQEQVVWQSVWSPSTPGGLTGTPIYRLLNPFNGDHHYTADSNEYATLPGSGWVQEGVAYYSADGQWDPELGGQPVYRLYNAYQTANGGLGSHLWTTSANENATLAAGGWTQEGASIFGVR